MFEKQRLTYLSHLGIENYMPRRELPGAASSALLSDDVFEQNITQLDEEISIQPLSNSETLATQKQASRVQPSIAIETILSSSKTVDDVQSENIDAVTTEATIENSDVDSDKENIRFILNVWRIEPDILVIDSREAGSALPTDRLLQNILRSIGYSLAQLPVSEIIRWPLFNEQKSCAFEARAMVQAYINAYCESASAKAIILMGKNAIRFSLDVGEEAEIFYQQQCGSIIMQPQWSVNVALIPSLADMLHDPLQKHLAWQALQLLK